MCDQTEPLKATHLNSLRITFMVVFNTAVFSLTCCISYRYSCTVFAFGQTGSGKTYTITGPHSLVRSQVFLGSLIRWKKQRN